MVAKIKTFSFAGIDAIPVNVQVKISSGLPSFSIVGLPDKAVGESKERVRAAISSTGLSWPHQKITVNLAPADLQKEGSHFDLAIAMAIIVEMGVITNDKIENFFVLGELSLDGGINPIGGVISAAVTANQHNCGLICPIENGQEASWAGELKIITSHNLLNLISNFKSENLIFYKGKERKIIETKYPDLSEVKGHETAKRALEVAAAGGHNILMIGPPGSGKSMLASRLPGILPQPELEEILEINMIASISGRIIDGNLIANRPYRDPHHSCSVAAMVGGGAKAKPGEISLASNGVLFLDELAEFPRQVLDSLRQPLENGNVTISRVNSHVNYPANFQLVAAMNPCRCGYLGYANKECKKSPHCGEEYKNKISGPLLDRIDIIINVSQVNIFHHQSRITEGSKEILARVKFARQIQKKRYQSEIMMQNLPKINGKINGDILEKFCKLSEEGRKILENSVNKMNSSMRGITRILRVARTIADLENSQNITNNHLLEAISYRRNL